MVVYPEEFKKEAKRLYPTWDRLHMMIDHGNQFIGDDLELSSRDGGIPAHLVIRVNTQEDLDKLKERAQRIVDKRNLYGWYLFIMGSRHGEE